MCVEVKRRNLEPKVVHVGSLRTFVYYYFFTRSTYSNYEKNILKNRIEIDIHSIILDNKSLVVYRKHL